MDGIPDQPAIWIEREEVNPKEIPERYFQQRWSLSHLWSSHHNLHFLCTLNNLEPILSLTYILVSLHWGE